MGNHAYIDAFGQRVTTGQKGRRAAMSRLMLA
jgi:hypothetical protein